MSIKADPELLAAFGQRLKLARKGSGISMTALGAMVGVSTAQISKYERGGCMPRSSILIELARALDVSVDFLMATHTTHVEWLRESKSPPLRG